VTSPYSIKNKKEEIVGKIMENFKKQIYYIEKKDLSLPITNTVSLDNLRNFSFDNLYTLIQTIANKHFVDINSSSNAGNKDILSLTDNKELLYDEKQLYDGEDSEEFQDPDIEKEKNEELKERINNNNENTEKKELKEEEKWNKSAIINNKILMKETNLNLVNIFNKNVNLPPNNGGSSGNSNESGKDNKSSGGLNPLNTHFNDIIGSTGYSLAETKSTKSNKSSNSDDHIQLSDDLINNIFTNLTTLVVNLNETETDIAGRIKAFLKLYTQHYVFANSTNTAIHNTISKNLILDNKKVAYLVVNSTLDYFNLATFWLSYIYQATYTNKDKDNYNLIMYKDIFAELFDAIETKLITYSEPVSENWLNFIKALPLYTDRLVDHLGKINQIFVPSKKDKNPIHLRVYPWVIPILYKQNISLCEAVFNKLLELTLLSVHAGSFVIDNFYDKENGYYEKKICTFAMKEFNEIKHLKTDNKNLIRSKLYLFFILCSKRNSINKNFCKEIPVIYSASENARNTIESNVPFLREDLMSIEEIIEVVIKCDQNCEKLVEIISNNFNIEKQDKIILKNEIISYIEKYQKYDLLYNIVNKLSFEDISDRIIPLLFLNFNVGTSLEKPEDKIFIEILKKINGITYYNNINVNDIVIAANNSENTNTNNNNTNTTNKTLIKEGLLNIIYYYALQKNQVSQVNNQISQVYQQNINLHNSNLLKIKQNLIKFYCLLKNSTNNEQLTDFSNFTEHIVNIQDNFLWSSIIWMFFEFSTHNHELKLIILGKSFYINIRKIKNIIARKQRCI